MNFDSKDKTENRDFEGSKFREKVYSKVVRAGKRTYFFDVKATRKDELYLTITESKKRGDYDDNAFFEKFKIFLYREDFENFSNGLADVLDYIKENQPPTGEDENSILNRDFVEVDFDDLVK
jgi:hypothetical protein